MFSIASCIVFFLSQLCKWRGLFRTGVCLPVLQDYRESSYRTCAGVLVDKNQLCRSGHVEILQVKGGSREEVGALQSPAEAFCVCCPPLCHSVYLLCQNSHLMPAFLLWTQCQVCAVAVSKPLSGTSAFYRGTGPQHTWFLCVVEAVWAFSHSCSELRWIVCAWSPVACPHFQLPTLHINMCGWNSAKHVLFTA